MKVYHIIFSVLFSFGIFGLNAQQKITTEEYISTYKDLAIREMERSGIPASITLAQGILESASGNSRLAVKANNHFGIKCHDWEGNRVFHDDDAKGECFRHYKSTEESFLDHTDFLMTRSRYAFLFEYRHTDYKNWAKGLRKAGYATDPKYPQLLIDLIERYDLHQYDTGISVSKKNVKKTQKGDQASTVQKSPKKVIPMDDVSISVERYQVMENNGTNFVIAKNGDTYASLTKELDMMPWQLPKYNETHVSAPLSEGQVIYLQPKRRKAERGMEVHVLQDGETMYDVSQKYGVKLKRLYILNRLDEGSEPPAGTQLNLRKKKKAH